MRPRNSSASSSSLQNTVRRPRARTYDGAGDRPFRKSRAGNKSPTQVKTGTVADRIRALNASNTATSSKPSFARTTTSSLARTGRMNDDVAEKVEQKSKPVACYITNRPRPNSPSRRTTDRVNPFSRRRPSDTTQNSRSPTQGVQSPSPTFSIQSPNPRRIFAPSRWGKEPEVELDASRGDLAPDSRAGFGRRETQRFASPATRRTSRPWERSNEINRRRNSRPLVQRACGHVEPMAMIEIPGGAGEARIIEEGGEAIPVLVVPKQRGKSGVTSSRAGTWAEMAPVDLPLAVLCTDCEAEQRSESEHSVRRTDSALPDITPLSPTSGRLSQRSNTVSSGTLSPLQNGTSGAESPRDTTLSRQLALVADTGARGSPATKVNSAVGTEILQLIDTVLTEHSNTLKMVIANLGAAAPGLEEIRRLSRELLEVPLQGTAIPPRTEIQDRPFVAPPTSPNINDPPGLLRRRTQSVPDLLNLIDSAADNFGLDLKTGTDDAATQTQDVGEANLTDQARTDSYSPVLDSYLDVMPHPSSTNTSLTVHHSDSPASQQSPPRFDSPHPRAPSSYGSYTYSHHSTEAPRSLSPPINPYDHDHHSTHSSTPSIQIPGNFPTTPKVGPSRTGSHYPFPPYSSSPRSAGSGGGASSHAPRQQTDSRATSRRQTASSYSSTGVSPTHHPPLGPRAARPSLSRHESTRPKSFASFASEASSHAFSRIPSRASSPTGGGSDDSSDVDAVLDRRHTLLEPAAWTVFRLWAKDRDGAARTSELGGDGGEAVGRDGLAREEREERSGRGRDEDARPAASARPMAERPMVRRFTPPKRVMTVVKGEALGVLGRLRKAGRVE